MERDTKNLKNLEKCGFLALIVMLFTGTIFGVLGAALAHILMKHFESHLIYIILLFPIIMAFVLGIGTNLGARIGRCSRLKIPVVVLILFLSVASYSLFLFLNYYYDIQEEKPSTIPEEFFWLVEETQNFFGEFPYVSDYIQPVENSQRGNIGSRVTGFINVFPDKLTEPVVISNIVLLTSFKDYLVYPGITFWDEEKGQLVFDNNIVKQWMLWTVEGVCILLISLLITRNGTKKVYKKRLKRIERSGMRVDKGKPKPKSKPQKEKKGLFGRKKKRKEAAVPGGLDLTPQVSHDENEGVAEKKKKKKKKKFSFFWGKKKAKPPAKVEEAQEVTDEPESEPTVRPVETKLEMTLPEDQESAQYALILHQYTPSREEDLVQLIQHISQVTGDKARKLLKVPSLLKRDVSAQDARIAIEKFNQVQAQVKLITMEQLLEIQKKQQQSVRPAPAAPQPSSSQDVSAGARDERYALILRRFDSSQRQSVLELLSSLSGKPVNQLQQTLKTPALILRDATKDEVTMIAQQFQSLQAEVKSLTMAELQKLMAKNK